MSTAQLEPCAPPPRRLMRLTRHVFILCLLFFRRRIKKKKITVEVFVVGVFCRCRLNMVFVTRSACRNESHASSGSPSSFLSRLSGAQILQTQSGVSIGGTYRYHPRAFPAVGEGLVLEAVSLVPSRQSVRLLAEQNEMINSASNPTAGVRKMLTEGMVGAGFGMEMSPPLPPDMTNTSEVRGGV